MIAAAPEMAIAAELESHLAVAAENSCIHCIHSTSWDCQEYIADIATRFLVDDSAQRHHSVRPVASHLEDLTCWMLLVASLPETSCISSWKTNFVVAEVVLVMALAATRVPPLAVPEYCYSQHLLFHVADKQWLDGLPSLLLEPCVDMYCISSC